MNGFTIFTLALVVVGLPVTLGIGSEMAKGRGLIVPHNIEWLRDAPLN